MIDNFAKIREHLTFRNPNEFYFLQIIQRKKDGNEGLHLRNGYRLIRSYYIYSIEQLDSLEERIKELCESNNARAYINPNVRNAQEVALECIKKYASLVAGNCAFQGNNVWDSTCGSTHARGYKALWIIDIDVPEQLDLIKNIILTCKHSDSFIMYEVKTVHGFHLVCNGFNSAQFNDEIKNRGLDKVDIHKNNPTLLYYNDLSSKQEQGIV